MRLPLHHSRSATSVSLAALALAMLTASSPSHAATCSATAFGCPATGTCIITGTWIVGPDCVLDFGARPIEIKGTLQAEIRGGAFQVRASTVSLNGGKLRSLGDADEPGGSVVVLASEAFRMQGAGSRIDTSGNGGGGSILVNAATVDLQTGVIAADGGSDENCDDGGVIALEATGTLTSAITLRAIAGTHCGGGEVALVGGAVSVSGDIDAHGGASSSDEAIVISALASDVVLSGLAALNASGTGQADGYGADGGQVSITSETGSIVLGGSSVTASGKAPYGSGGAVSLAAPQNITISSRLSLPGGSNGYGGEVVVEAGGILTVNGDILVQGGASAPYGQGGVVELFAAGGAAISSTIDATALLGGDISVESSAGLTVSGSLTTRGSRVSGGTIGITGCVVGIGGTLDSSGSNGALPGDIEVDGGTISLTSGAALQATPCPGGSCITLVTPMSQPSIAPDALIAPAPTVEIVPDLRVCG